MQWRENLQTPVFKTLHLSMYFIILVAKWWDRNRVKGGFQSDSLTSVKMNEQHVGIFVETNIPDVGSTSLAPL